MVSLCGSVLFGERASDSSGEGKWLQYRFGKKAKLDLVFPPDRSESVAQFKGTYIGNKLEELLISFAVGDFKYAVEQSYAFNGVQVYQLDYLGNRTGLKDFSCNGAPATSYTSYGRSNMDELTTRLEQIATDMEQLRWVESADPILDAQNAVRRKDYALFNLPYYERGSPGSVPGVEAPEKLLSRGNQAYRPIVGAENTGLVAGHDRLLQRAIEYAGKYNQFILLHQGEDNQ